ncbi:MAG: glycosyltransferase [Pirellulales bacterium]|nr:glycosyltransferase [Pirellulales bacterium]
MERLPVALCITELDVGGAERCLERLATRLDRDRFAPVVYVVAPRPEGDLACLSALKAGGVEVCFLGFRRKWQLPLAVGRLANRLRRQKPVVTQSFLFHANIVARLAARLAGVPVVLSGIRVAERRSRWPLRVDRMTEGLVDRHVCVSQSVAQFAQRVAGLSQSKLVVIPNGIDPGQYVAQTPADLRSMNIDAGRRLVTYVGRLDPQKGLPWLIEGAKSWLGRVADCDLILVGRGPERNALESLVAQWGIADRVHFLGFRNDVPAILARSELVVLPSRWEGMPNAVLEAMAAGRPVVATDVEGVAELLGPNAAAQSVGYGQTEAFVEKIVGLLGDRELAGRLGRENRRRVEQKYTIESMVEAYESLWESLATQTNRASRGSAESQG